MVSITHDAVRHTSHGASQRTITSSKGETFTVYLRHLLGQTRRGMLTWLVSVAAYGALIVAIFPSMRETLGTTEYPEALQNAFSMSDMTRIDSFLTAEIFSYLPLVVAFIPIMYFTGALAGAEERGALDVLLGTPLPRRQLVLTTFLTAAINLLLVTLGLAAALWLTSLAVDAGLSLGDALAGSLAVWPAALALGSVGLLAGAMMRQRAKALGVTIGVMFAMYALFVVSRLVDGLGGLKWLSAFHYYGSAVQDGVYWTGVAVLLATAAILIALAVRVFDRRDIYT